jgi:hypothetical protein
MNTDNTQDGAEPTPASDGSVRFASGRICTIPYDDPMGPFVAGVILVPIVGIVLLAILSAFCNCMEYGQCIAPSSTSSPQGSGQ